MRCWATTTEAEDFASIRGIFGQKLRLSTEKRANSNLLERMHSFPMSFQKKSGFSNFENIRE